MEELAEERKRRPTRRREPTVVANQVTEVKQQVMANHGLSAKTHIGLQPSPGAAFCLGRPTLGTQPSFGGSSDPNCHLG